MVRTKADAGSTKVSAAKAPRKIASSGGGSSGASPCRAGGSKDRFSGGNAYNPQPTPNWQKGISAFFKQKPSEDVPCASKVTDAAESGSSSSSSSRSRTPIETEVGESSCSRDGPSFEKNGLVSDDDD